MFPSHDLWYFEQEENPIEAAPHMATQLSEEEPPVDDPEFVPGSLRELGLAAMRLMREVPDNQVEFVYRFLHRLLDMAIDREEESQDFGEMTLTEELLKHLLSEAVDRSQALKDAAVDLQSGAPRNSVISRLRSSGVFDEETDQDIEEALQDALIELLMDIPEEESEEDSEDVADPRQEDLVAPAAPATPKKIEKAQPTQEDELQGDAREKYEEASDKDEFMKGFNAGADDSAAGRESADNTQQTADYVTGYIEGYEDAITLASQPNEPEQREKQTRKDNFRKKYKSEATEKLKNHPIYGKLELLYMLMPLLETISHDLAIELDVAAFDAMRTRKASGATAGAITGQADEIAAQKYGIARTAPHYEYNMNKNYFTKDFGNRVARQVIDKLIGGTLNITDDQKAFNEMFEDLAD